MVLQTFRMAVLAGATLALAACGGRESTEVVRPANATFQSADSRICLSDLKSKSVKFSALPNQSFGGGCRMIDTIKLMDFGTPTTNLGAMTCPLAANFAAWARHAVSPAARQYLDSDVIRIETMGTYSCRNVNGGRSGKLSQHAFGNAVDISAFVLKDGRRISVLGGWRGDKAEQQFLRRLHQSACKRFGTVLGPDYNSAHANHFHFDMAQSMKDGSSYCR
jgi:hypothetical protein